MGRTVVRLLVVVVAAAGYVIRIPPGWVETFYSRRFYGSLQPVLTGLSNRVPFALFDVLLAGGLVLLIVWFARTVRRVRRGPFLRQSAGSFLTLLTAAALVYLGFLLLWGLNYERQPLASKLVFDTRQATPEGVRRLAGDAVRQLNGLHDRAHRDGFPVWERLTPEMDASFHLVQAHLVAGARPASGVPKPSLLGYYFARSGVSGMTDPFFLEVLVDRSLLPFERPFVLAHEWAHLAGYADEAEANFIGWLTCVNGSPPDAYSGWLYLYSEALAALPRADRTAFVRMLAPGPRQDLTAVAERARRIQPVIQAVSWRVYDRYLKANRVGEGIASYDRALVLLLGAKYTNGWMPVVRQAEPSEGPKVRESEGR